MEEHILAIKNITKENTAKELYEVISDLYEGSEGMNKEDFYETINEFIRTQYLFESDYTITK